MGYRSAPALAKAGDTYTGGMHGGTVNLNCYDAREPDIRYALARYGL